MTPPVQEVLSTPKLLEMILLRLDEPRADAEGRIIGLKTLLLSQRVNNTFGALILGSPTLQRALFFRPDETAGQDRQCRTGLPMSFVNPFLTTGAIIAVPGTDGELRFNRIRSDSETLRLTFFRARNCSDRANFGIVQGSWKRMIACHPPMPQHIRWDSAGSYANYCVQVSTAAVSTLGEMVELFLAGERDKHEGGWNANGRRKRGIHGWFGNFHVDRAVANSHMRRRTVASRDVRLTPVT